MKRFAVLLIVFALLLPFTAVTFAAENGNVDFSEAVPVYLTGGSDGSFHYTGYVPDGSYYAVLHIGSQSMPFGKVFLDWVPSGDSPNVFTCSYPGFPGYSATMTLHQGVYDIVISVYDADGNKLVADGNYLFELSPIDPPSTVFLVSVTSFLSAIVGWLGNLLNAFLSPDGALYSLFPFAAIAFTLGLVFGVLFLIKKFIPHL